MKPSKLRARHLVALAPNDKGGLLYSRLYHKAKLYLSLARLTELPLGIVPVRPYG